MSQKIECTKCGYIPRDSGMSNTSNLNISTDIYGKNSSGTEFLGVIQFTSPIASTNITWQQIHFTSVKLHLFNSTAQQLPSSNGLWTVGVSGVLRNSAANSNLPSDCVYQNNFTPGDVTRGYENIWDLTELFNSIKTKTNYSLQPNTNTWYIYIKPQSGIGNNSYFARMTQKIHFLLIDNITYNPIKYYNENGAWEDCQAKYYNGSTWVNIIPSYYNGSNWQQV